MFEQTREKHFLVTMLTHVKQLSEIRKGKGEKRSRYGSIAFKKAFFTLDLIVNPFFSILC